MKKFKLLSSIAAVAAISCVAAATTMAADSVELKTNMTESTADSKVIEVYYTGDSIDSFYSVGSLIIEFTDIESEIKAENWSAASEGLACTVSAGKCTLKHPVGTKLMTPVQNKSLLLGKFTIADTDSISASVTTVSFNGHNAAYPDDDTKSINLKYNPKNPTTATISVDNLSVLNAADLGTFTDGEGDPAKAYKATLTGEGAITWYVRDGKGNVADKALTEFTGGAGVIVGLVATGANVANINYATVTID